MLVANSIVESGSSIDIIAQYPVTSLDPVGHSASFKADATHHRGVEFNLKDLEDAIVKSTEGRRLDRDERINAFSSGLDPYGRIRDVRIELNDYVVPIEFYHIEVNTNVDYMKGRRK